MIRQLELLDFHNKLTVNIYGREKISKAYLCSHRTSPLEWLQFSWVLSYRILSTELKNSGLVPWLQLTATTVK